MSRIVGAWENKGLTGPRNLWRPDASCSCQSACVTWNVSPQSYSLPCVTQETWNTWVRQHLMVPGTWEKLGTQFMAHGHLEATLNISSVPRFPTKAGQRTGDRWGQSPEGSSCGKGRRGDRSQTCVCRARGEVFPMWPSAQEGVLGHVRDAGHLATCGPQLSLEISVVRDRQRLGLFLVVKVAAADSLQVRGDRCIDGGPGSLIWGLRGQGRRPGRVGFGSTARGILGAPTDASFQGGWGGVAAFLGNGHRVGGQQSAKRSWERRQDT